MYNLTMEREYKVIVQKDGELVTETWSERPPIGGYKSTERYGRPDFCAPATPRHREAIRKTGKAPNLVWFGSVEAAVASGYVPCGSCWITGPEALERWGQYERLCRELGIRQKKETPEVIKRMRARR